ncbi:molybdopterin-guanine dinucleotide biosynthesis protein MobA [Halochromatium glycolicum]|uniref:Molybdopterin-guanine dinucleotide biosynthesis protein MobA n=1 Tax=Halochromatium glycolicum TaxID=85075 RepID=A0AAJ0X966_9GAMM|nr:molybdopterin-guanine dinucleotide biosynthesis protein MobA [Halochromatium glycolicum]
MPVGILLAAGKGRRFGGDKRLHPLADGTPMVVAAARALSAALPRTLAVVREADEVAQRLAREGVEVICCPAAAGGMGHSIACGVAASAEADGWLIALGDMPWVRPESIAAVAAALAEGAPVARPCYTGRHGHPVGFSAPFGSDLQRLDGDNGARHLLRSVHVVEIPCTDPGVIRDVDDPRHLQPSPPR